MTELAAALVVAATVVGVVVWSRLSGVVRRRRHRPVMVTLKSGGTAFRGTLVGDDGRAIALAGVEAIDEGRTVPVDGEVIVPWGDVKYLQRL